VITRQRTFREYFLLICTLLAGFSFFASWIQTFYFGKPTSAILSFKADDGWCPSPGSGIGIHCFGDYYHPLFLHTHDQPDVYTPLGSAIFRPFFKFGYIFDSSKAGLIAYLGLGLISMFSIVLWAIQNTKSNRLLLLLLFGFLATPIAIAFDRGNSAMFALPPLLIFCIAFSKKQWSMCVLAIVLATAVKPQYVLLVIPLLATKKWRIILISIGGVLLAQMMGFALLTQHPVLAFKIWGKNLKGYQNRLISDLVFGGNFSFSQSFYDFSKVFERAFSGRNKNLSQFVYTHSTVLTILALLVICLLVLLVGRHIGTLGALFISLPLASFAPGVSWSYYQVFAVVLAAFLVTDHTQDGKSTDESRIDHEVNTGSMGRPTAWFAIIATAITCFNLPLEADILPFYVGQYSISSAFVAPLWACVIFCVLKDAFKATWLEKRATTLASI